MDLDEVVRKTSDYIDTYQVKLADQYDYIIGEMRFAEITGTHEKKLIKEVITYMQTEKTLRKTKIDRVFSNLVDEAAVLIKDNTTPQPVAAQPAPATAPVSQVKYRPPDLTACTLNFLCSPFDFIE